MKSSGRSATAARFAVRFLLEEPDRGWCNYPLTQGLAAYQERLRLPALANETVRVAFAHLARGSDGIQRLDRLSVGTLRLNAAGQVDEDYLMAEIIARIDPPLEPIDFGLTATVPVSVLDVQAICRCIGVELPARFQQAP